MATEFKEKDDEEGFSFVTRRKFPSGMTGVLELELVGVSNKAETFNAHLYLTRKRKAEVDYTALTGRDGLETASWVLGALTDFEGFISEDSPAETVRLIVSATDRRRWDLYVRVLTKRGFSVTMYDGIPTLVKRIRR